MAQKQLTMFLIAHNLIRWLLLRARRANGSPIRRLLAKQKRATAAKTAT